MPASQALVDAVSHAVAMLGEKEVVDTLNTLVDTHSKSRDVLTIIGNAEMHTIPEAYIHGEIYTVSSGNLDLSSLEAIHKEYISVLRLLAEKLRERAWKQIYFIPTGPTTLTLQIKLLAYHITRLSTVDLFYSRGTYFELDLDYRTYLDHNER